MQLLAYRHKKVVARTKLWKVHKGWATFRLLLFRNKWPTALAFILVEHGKKTVCAGCPGQNKTAAAAVVGEHRVDRSRPGRVGRRRFRDPLTCAAAG